MNWAPIVRELRLFGLEPAGTGGELLVTCPDCNFMTLHGFDAPTYWGPDQAGPNWQYSVEAARRDLHYHRRACHDSAALGPLLPQQVWQRAWWGTSP